MNLFFDEENPPICPDTDYFITTYHNSLQAKVLKCSEVDNPEYQTPYAIDNDCASEDEESVAAEDLALYV